MKYYAELTNEEARDWLVRKDKKSADFWRDSQSQTLKNDVYYNIRDLGIDDEVEIFKLVGIHDEWCSITSFAGHLGFALRGKNRLSIYKQLLGQKCEAVLITPDRDEEQNELNEYFGATA